MLEARYALPLRGRAVVATAMIVATMAPGAARARGPAPADETEQAPGATAPAGEEASVARAKELGLCVAVWTVNEPDDIDRMIDLHVDAIVTDYPGRLQRRLSDRGFRWLSDV